MKRRNRKRIMAALLSASLAVSNAMFLPVNGLVAAAEEEQTEEVVLASWIDQAGYEAWYYGDGWEYNYSGKDNSAVAYDAEMDALKLTVDYSADAAQDWSQMAACYYNDDLNLAGATKLELDFLYDTTLATGGFTIKAYTNGNVDDSVAVNKEEAETVSGNISKVHVTVPFANPAEQTPDLAVCIIGNATDYKGDLWLQNITVSKVQTPAADIDVDSTIPVNDQTNLSLDDLTLPSAVTLVDKDADAATKAVYAYLKAVGESDYVIYGHQSDTWHKAGSKELTNSDTKDVTGSISGIVGFDGLTLVGNEYSAKRYNAEIAAVTGEEELPETMAGNIEAASKDYQYGN